MLLNHENSAQSIDSIIKKASAWGIVILVQSLLSIIWLLLIPKEPGNAVFLGYSLKRLMLLLPMGIPLALSIICIFTREGIEKILQRITEKDKLTSSAIYLLITGVFLAFITWTFLLIMPMVLHQVRRLGDFGLYYRLIPLVLNYLLIGLEAIIFIPLFFFPRKFQKDSRQEKLPLKIFLAVFLILLSIFVLIEFTGLGKNPERVSIITLGVPLLEGHIWYISGLLVLSMLSLTAWQALPDATRPAMHKHGDVVIAVLLWLIAFAVWMSLPLPQHNYFAPAAQPPNFEKYPFSDAEQYDYNSLFLLYGSIENFVISKPGYVSLLAILHAIGGLSYAGIVFFQTMIMALIPSVLYLIGRELHSRLGGIAMALFAIFREFSSILYSSTGNVANSKLLLSDGPAVLLVAVLVLILIRWFNNKEKMISGHEFLAGGLIGVLSLMRIQALLLLPPALILITLRYYPRIKTIFLSSLILTLCFLLVVTPILMRNHSITGVYWLDNPSSSAPLSRILTEGLDSFEDEELFKSGDEVVSQNFTIYTDLLFNNFGFFVGFVFDHFFRNIISSFLIMPIRLGNPIQFFDFLTISGYFWGEVYAAANFINLALIIINLALISVGISAVFSKNRKGLFLVIGFFLYYNLTSSIARLSGWRFILPVDWIVFSLYALGLLEALKVVFTRVPNLDFNATSSWFAGFTQSSQKFHQSRSWYLVFGLIFVFTGSLIPARELFPSLVPQYTRSEVCEMIEKGISEQNDPILQANIKDLCESGKARVNWGTGISPRYFAENEGFYDRENDRLFGYQSYSRLVFRVIGNRNTRVYIQTNRQEIHFKNGATVFVIDLEGGTEGAILTFVNTDPVEIILSNSPAYENLLFGVNK
jgi:hypothetical protein